MYIVADIKLSCKLGASQHTPNLSLNSSKVWPETIYRYYKTNCLNSWLIKLQVFNLCQIQTNSVWIWIPVRYSSADTDPNLNPSQIQTSSVRIWIPVRDGLHAARVLVLNKKVRHLECCNYSIHQSVFL